MCVWAAIECQSRRELRLLVRVTIRAGSWAGMEEEVNSKNENQYGCAGGLGEAEWA